MENFGCVTIAEASSLFRGQVTDFELEQRANIDPARDGAHVVRRPRDHALVGRPVAQRVLRRVGQPLVRTWRPPASTTPGRPSCRRARTGATAPDQQPTTHPVYTARGRHRGDPGQLRRHHLRQGRLDPQAARRLRRHRPVPGRAARSTSRSTQFGNAVFQDLLGELEAASRKPLEEFADTWLRDGRGLDPAPGRRRGLRRQLQPGRPCSRRLPAEHPTQRTHRIAIGLYDLEGGDRWCAATGSKWTSPARPPRSRRSPASSSRTCCCSTTTTSRTRSCAWTSGASPRRSSTPRRWRTRSPAR